MNNNLKTALSDNLEKNYIVYLIIILFLFTGIVLGVYATKYMNSINKDTLHNYFLSFITMAKEESTSSFNIFLESFKNNAILVMLIFFLGYTVIAIPIIIIIILIKGFTIGFSLSFILSTLGTKGIWVSISCIIPQNIFFILGILLIAALSMENSISKIMARINRLNYLNSNKATNMIPLLFTLLLILTGSFIESTVPIKIFKLF